MEAPWSGLAAIWYLGLLGSLARVAGTHYRYLWRGCYPCHLGQAGYPVSAGNPRPGGSGGLCAGRAGCALPRVRCLCFPPSQFAPREADGVVGGSGVGADGEAAAASGTGPVCPESSDIPDPSLAWLRGLLTAFRPLDQREEKRTAAVFARGHQGCTSPRHQQLRGLSRRGRVGRRERPLGSWSRVSFSRVPRPLGAVCGCGRCCPVTPPPTPAPQGWGVSSALWMAGSAGRTPAALGKQLNPCPESVLPLPRWYPRWASLLQEAPERLWVPWSLESGNLRNVTRGVVCRES